MRCLNCGREQLLIAGAYCTPCESARKSIHRFPPQPHPRISPELAAKIAEESYKFVDSNGDMYTDMTDSEMIDAIASIIERVGNED